MSLIGCHISTSGGVVNAPLRAQAFGCDIMQIFTANQMQWRGTPISPENRDQYINNLRKSGLQSVVSHDSYLINLSSPEPKKLALSLRAFTEEIKRSTLLGIPYIVFHPGSHMGKGDDYALQAIAESLDDCIERVPDAPVTLCLENTAGQGSNVGYKFEHLRTIIDRSQHPDRLGICFDTCHAFAAGYDLIKETAYKITFQQFDDIIGLDRLKVFHLNDSKKALGSRVDRHHQLGEGLLGMKPFHRLVNDERFRNIPMILETPGNEEHYIKEIKLLKDAIK